MSRLRIVLWLSFLAFAAVPSWAEIRCSSWANQGNYGGEQGEWCRYCEYTEQGAGYQECTRGGSGAGGDPTGGTCSVDFPCEVEEPYCWPGQCDTGGGQEPTPEPSPSPSPSPSPTSPPVDCTMPSSAPAQGTTCAVGPEEAAAPRTPAPGSLGKAACSTSNPYEDYEYCVYRCMEMEMSRVWGENIPASQLMFWFATTSTVGIAGSGGLAAVGALGAVPLALPVGYGLGTSIRCRWVCHFSTCAY